FAYLAPARHLGRIVGVGRPGMDHVAWANLVQQVLRIVGMCRVFHRVEVIQVSEELVEPMDSGQKLIEIAQVIFTELTSCIALRFERSGDRTSLRWDAGLSAGLADRRHARA